MGTFELGKVSNTEDIEGEVIGRNVLAVPNMETVKAVVASFLGVQQQMPPAFSALKVNGKRAYDLARNGEKVELQHVKFMCCRLKW